MKNVTWPAKSGRGPKGKLRNFRAMSDEKFGRVHKAVLTELNDLEAMAAVREERQRRLSETTFFGSLLSSLKRLGVFEDA